MNDLSIYASSLAELKTKIKTARIKMAVVANTQLLRVYWEIGYFISKQEQTEGWGAKIVELLSNDLKSEFPDIKGFSPRNLRYMRDFYSAYPEFYYSSDSSEESQTIENESVSILQQAVAKLPWSHHLVILDKVKHKDARSFYIIESNRSNWGRNILALQIENRLYERQGKSLNNFEGTLPPAQADLAKETFKNPYLFEFIDLDEEFQERELEKALVERLKEFLLELGRGFAYINRQYRLLVEGDEFYIDLLFYNTHLHCYVVLELKIGEFKPEYTGKLQFYINAIDGQIKTNDDKPTIGILLCKTPNKTLVEYSLGGIDKPMGVAEFKLPHELPEFLKDELPSVEEFRSEIEKEIEMIEAPLKGKLDRLKQVINELNEDEIKQKITPETAIKIFREIVIPIRNNIQNSIDRELASLFVSHDIYTATGGQWKNTDQEIENYLSQNGYADIKIDFQFNGFKKAGINTFDISKQVVISLLNYKYSIACREPQIKKEKLYHNLLSKAEIATLSEDIISNIIESIEMKLESLKTK